MQAGDPTSTPARPVNPEAESGNGRPYIISSCYSLILFVILAPIVSGSARIMGHSTHEF